MVYFVGTALNRMKNIKKLANKIFIKSLMNILKMIIKIIMRMKKTTIKAVQIIKEINSSKINISISKQNWKS